MGCSTAPKWAGWRIGVFWNGDVPVSVVSDGFAWADGAAPAIKAPHEVPSKRQRGAVWQKPRRGETGITSDFNLIPIRNGDAGATNGVNGALSRGKGSFGVGPGIGASDFWRASHGTSFPGDFPKIGNHIKGPGLRVPGLRQQGEVPWNLAFFYPVAAWGPLENGEITRSIHLPNTSLTQRVYNLQHP